MSPPCMSCRAHTRTRSGTPAPTLTHTPTQTCAQAHTYAHKRYNTHRRAHTHTHIHTHTHTGARTVPKPIRLLNTTSLTSPSCVPVQTHTHAHGRAERQEERLLHHWKLSNAEAAHTDGTFTSRTQINKAATFFANKPDPVHSTTASVRPCAPSVSRCCSVSQTCFPPCSPQAVCVCVCVCAFTLHKHVCVRAGVRVSLHVLRAHRCRCV